MADRSRSKARDRKKAKKPRVKLTLKEMLDRVPDSEFVNTKQARRIFNDCTDVTIYRYVQQGKLTKRRRHGSAASWYPRDEVVALVRAHFIPRLVSESESRNGAEEDDEKRPKKRKKKPKRKPGGRVRRKAKGNRK